MEKRLLDINELSEYLGIPKQTIYQWTSQQRIPFIKIGRLKEKQILVGSLIYEKLNIVDVLRKLVNDLERHKKNGE